MGGGSRAVKSKPMQFEFPMVCKRTGSKHSKCATALTPELARAAITHAYGDQFEIGAVPVSTRSAHYFAAEIDCT